MAVDFIPEKFYVARQPRGDSDEVLGFMVSMNKDGYSSRKDTADRWAKGWRGQVPLEPIEVLNVPLSGFSLTENKRRMMNKNVIWRCLHPEGFEFEITSDNFSDFLMEIDMKQGIIQTEMIFIRRAGENYLTWVGSPAHKEAVSQDVVETKVSVKDIQPGDKFTFKNGERGQYIGGFHVIGMKNRITNSHRPDIIPTTIDEKSTKQHFYYNLYDEGKVSTIDNKSSLTIVSVDSRMDTPPTLDESYDLLLLEIQKPNNCLSVKDSMIVHIEHKPFNRTDLKTTLVEHNYNDLSEIFSRNQYYNMPGNTIITVKNKDGYYSPRASFDYHYQNSGSSMYSLKEINISKLHEVELALNESVLAVRTALETTRHHYGRSSTEWKIQHTSIVLPAEIDKVYIQKFERV